MKTICQGEKRKGLAPTGYVHGYTSHLLLSEDLLISPSPPVSGGGPMKQTIHSFTLSPYFLIDFLAHFYVHRKIKQEEQKISISTLAPPTHKCRHLTPQSGTFAAITKPTRTHHYNPKCIVHLGIYSWFVHSVGLNKCIRTCIHHSRITQRSLIALTILCALQFICLCPLAFGNH